MVVDFFAADIDHEPENENDRSHSEWRYEAAGVARVVDEPVK